MRPPTTKQLSRMQDHAEESMWDTCQILEYNGEALDSYGQQVQKYFLRWPAIACGYSSKSSEVMVDTQVFMSDGVLRLPIDTELENLDRIIVTYRHGVLMSDPLTFEILGQPMRGPSALVMNLKLVTDGSDTQD